MTQQIQAAFASDFLHRLHAAVNAHDADTIASLCGEDVRWHDTPWCWICSRSRVRSGRAETGQFR